MDTSTTTETTHPQTNDHGLWIGIDLGTTNSTAAVWDVHKCRPKLLRMGDLATSVHESLPYKKSKQIVPSVLFYENSMEKNDPVVRVGRDALDRMEYLEDREMADVPAAMLTSFKRIMGLQKEDFSKMNAAGELFNALPFQAVVVDDEDSSYWYARVRPFDGSKVEEGDGDDVIVEASGSDDAIDVDPIRASAILLRKIRCGAERYLKTGKIAAPGLTMRYNCEQQISVRNCVIGCPANYTRLQRDAIVKSCKLAGFDGTVHVLTESTAAAMAYGIDVAGGPKNVLVFDMGGGTTDVSVVRYNEDIQNDHDESFHVIATGGNTYLGGDDIDDLLVKWIIGEINDIQYSSIIGSNNIRRKCREAKEKLCGNGSSDQTLSSVYIDVGKRSVLLTIDVFNDVISPVVLKARAIVEEVLVSCDNKMGQEDKFRVDEVVLVGGASRVPAIRQMLSKRFPPPHPPSLCFSVNADSAVAYGAAILSASMSRLVPKHEIRSALMLDALPHTIGVLVPDIGEDISGDKNTNFLLKGKFVPILMKDSQLPSKGSLTFSLSDVKQNGVTILAYENVSRNDLDLKFISEFTFLLHKLPPNALLDRRDIEVGMICDINGSLTVSIFDPNDPEHRLTRNQCTIEENSSDTDLLSCEEEYVTPKEQMMLFGSIFVLVVSYVAAKLMFNEIINNNEGQMLD